jgi:transcriptional regulator with XRE-family HTH domain
MDNKITNENLKRMLSQKLAMLREKSGQTMEAAAYDLDMNVSDYFRLLKGQRLPHLLNLLRLSKKYGVSLDWWFRELQEIPRSAAQSQRDSFEAQALLVLKKLDSKLQPSALSLLKASVKNLMRASQA